MQNPFLSNIARLASLSWIYYPEYVKKWKQTAVISHRISLFGFAKFSKDRSWLPKQGMKCRHRRLDSYTPICELVSHLIVSNYSFPVVRNCTDCDSLRQILQL